MSDAIASRTRQFGRAWKVVISDGGNVILSFGSDAWLPETLHITFDTTQYIRESYWSCDLSLYNLNAPTEQSVIKQGMQITLEAGYQSQPYGVIFSGTIFQPLWEIENGVDYKLTLRCIVGLIENTNNSINLTVGEGKTQREIVANMAAAFRNKIEATDLSPALESTKQSRASTYFGQPNDFLQAIADDADANLWFSNMALHIRQLQDAQVLPTISYSVNSGLIGTPQVTQDGVVLRVLLDPRVIIRGQVHLDQSILIKQLPREFGSFPTILAQSGTYVVGMVRHFGDSRGNDWYSEITGFVNAGSLLALQTQN